MRRHVTCAFSALALGWLAGTALAAEPVFYTPLLPGTSVESEDVQPMPPAKNGSPSAKTVKPTPVHKPAMPGSPPASAAKSCSSCPSGGCAPVSDSCTSCVSKGSACADDSCCDSCCKEICHFYAGGGVYLLQPTGTNVAWRSHLEFREPLNNNRFVIQNTSDNFNQDLQFAPRVWLGLVSPCGFGGRVRWFNFQTDDQISIANNHANNCGDPGPENCLTILSAAPFFGEPRFFAGRPTTVTDSGGDTVRIPNNEAEAVRTIAVGDGKTLLATNAIKLNVFDFEATQAVNAGNWMLLTSGGLRYARISQTYVAHEVNTLPIAVNNVLQTLTSANTIDGIGPTVALEVRRPLGDCGVALYGSARGAILFPDRRIQANYVDRNFNPGNETANQTFSRKFNDVLPVSEIEAGAQWSQSMTAMTPFLQVGVVSMNWFDAGSATSTQGNLGFIGLTVGAGMTY